jgi:ribonuclease VapC
VETEPTIIPFGEAHWRSAVDAYLRYGKGRHRAALNFGDCMAYAVAKLAQQPLLCAGADFAKTDLPLA